MGQSRYPRRWWPIVVAVLSFCLITFSQFNLPAARGQEPIPAFAHLADYPSHQFPEAGYLPVAEWSGRLILPDRAIAATADIDWVWLEVYTSPQPELIGQRVRLQWQDTPETRSFLERVTRGIEFDEEAFDSIAKGRIHPTRLNGWERVGPLQSLAGTRPQDDMIVALPSPQIKPGPDNTVLLIDTVPTQIPERFYSLVKVLGPSPGGPTPEFCPVRLCHSDYQRVQHYNPATQAFDGRIETVRIPQVPPKATGVFQSSTQDLADSPAGAAGWYIYGAKTAEGVFEVRAIAPRRLFQLEPQTVITGEHDALNYINFANWRDTPDRKGTLQSVLITAGAEQANRSDWQEGEQMLVIHLFGGIGGARAEPRSVPGTVTGHFAYGIGEVIRDPFTQERRLAITYYQVYSHNPQGIVAGRTQWAEYTGNLERGWLGTRPISDVLVKIPALSHTYRFGDMTLDPFAEFQRELMVMMARYRTGDGTGAAIVTPAKSCVQDSSQALYETIQVIRDRVATNPEVTAWLANHPNDPQTQLFENLISLGRELQRVLVPLGIARPDWQENAAELVGTEEPALLRAVEDPGFPHGVNTLIKNLLSWRTVIPRVAYDNILAILLDHGSEMWFLRTNQVGGENPAIAPLAPTELFGEYVVIPTAFSRLIEALRWPDWRDIGILLGGWLLFAIALWLGRSAGLSAGVARDLSAKTAAIALLTPALWQELVFRVLLLPHPTEGVQVITGIIWTAISLGGFMAYRWLRSLQRAGARPAQLYQSLVLGILATGLYFSTGSLWVSALFHWGAWLMVARSDRGIAFSLAKSFER